MAVLCRLSYASETLDSIAPAGASRHERRPGRRAAMTCATTCAASASDAAASGPPRAGRWVRGSPNTSGCTVGVADGDAVAWSVAPDDVAPGVDDLGGRKAPEVADGTGPDPLDARLTCFGVVEAGPMQGDATVLHRGSPPGLVRKACSTYRIRPPGG